MIPFGSQKLVTMEAEYLQSSRAKRINKLDAQDFRMLEDMILDITLENNQLKDRVNILSHNLRAPVSNLIILVELFQEISNEAEKPRLLEKIKSSLNTIQNNMKLLSNCSQCKIEASMVDFKSVLTETTKLLAGEIHEKNAIITSDFRDAPVIEYPQMYLSSYFLNLISNALKYSSRNRKLHIHLASGINEDGKIFFSCEDNGLGINLQKYGEKIFGLNQTFHTNKDSKGIGLYITKNQIESLSGTIKVESKLRKGTRFSIVF
jgi:signal transduction histidine kinase